MNKCSTCKLFLPRCYKTVQFTETRSRRQSGLDEYQRSRIYSDASTGTYSLSELRDLVMCLYSSQQNGKMCVTRWMTDSRSWKRPPQSSDPHLAPPPRSLQARRGKESLLRSHTWAELQLSLTRCQSVPTQSSTRPLSLEERHRQIARLRQLYHNRRRSPPTELGDCRRVPFEGVW